MATWDRGTQSRSAGITVVIARSMEGKETTRVYSISRVNPIAATLTDDDAGDICKALIGLTTYGANDVNAVKKVRLSNSYDITESTTP